MAVPVVDKVLAAPKFTGPDQLLLPVDTRKVPPLRFRVSLPMDAFWISSTAPLATVAVPALLPKPLFCVTTTVPVSTVTLPLNVLAPDKVNTLLAVSFKTLPAPLITPLQVWSVLLLCCNCAPALRAMLPA